MKSLILTFLLFTNVVFSQNSGSYLATKIYDGLYNHFNRSGVKCLDSLKFKLLNGVSPSCDCNLSVTADLIFTLEKEDVDILKKDTAKTFIDQYMLNDFYYYELPEEYVLSEIKFFKKRKINFEYVCFKVDIKRINIRYNPFIRKKQIKYKVIVSYTYNLK
jgi:hypothetical protein